MTSTAPKKKKRKQKTTFGVCSHQAKKRSKRQKIWLSLSLDVNGPLTVISIGKKGFTATSVVSDQMRVAIVIITKRTILKRNGSFDLKNGSFLLSCIISQFRAKMMQ